MKQDLILTLIIVVPVVLLIVFLVVATMSCRVRLPCDLKIPPAPAGAKPEPNWPREPLMSASEYHATLTRFEELMTAPFCSSDPEAREFDKLLHQIEAYEKFHYPEVSR